MLAVPHHAHHTVCQGRVFEGEVFIYVVADKERLHECHLRMVGKLHRTQADLILQHLHALLFVRHLTAGYGRSDQQSGFGAKRGGAQAALRRRISIIPGLGTGRACLGLQADDFQKVAGAVDVLVVEPAQDNEAV